MAFIIPTIQLAESNSEITKKLILAISQEIFKKSQNIIGPLIRGRVRILVRNLIENTRVWQSILNGSLRGDLGIPLNTDLSFILDVWANSVRVNISRRRSVLTGAVGLVEVVGIKSTYSDVLSLNEAEYVSFPSRRTITWLEWLLLRGSEHLTQDFIVSRNNLTKRELRVSRTKQAIMRFRQGGSFTIPVFAEGTENDNFVTRALQGIDKSIEQIIIEEYSKNYP